MLLFSLVDGRFRAGFHRNFGVFRESWPREVVKSADACDQYRSLKPAAEESAYEESDWPMLQRIAPQPVHIFPTVLINMAEKIKAQLTGVSDEDVVISLQDIFAGRSQISGSFLLQAETRCDRAGAGCRSVQISNREQESGKADHEFNLRMHPCEMICPKFAQVCCQLKGATPLRFGIGRMVVGGLNQAMGGAKLGQAQETVL